MRRSPPEALALFVALADRWSQRSRVAAWAVTLAGLAVSVAGNVGHVAGHSLAARVTAAVPPLAAAAALAVGLGVLKRVVEHHHRGVGAGPAPEAAPEATAGPAVAASPGARAATRRKATAHGPDAATRAAAGAIAQGQPVPSARALARDHHIGRDRASQVRRGGARRVERARAMSATIHDTSTWAKPLRSRWIVKYRDGGTQHSALFDERSDAEQFAAGLNLAAAPKPPCAHCGSPLPDNRRRFCSDRCRHQRYRAERTVETAEFGRFAVYMIRALARRVGGSDIAEFGALWDVMAAAGNAVADAITGLRAAGFTWEELGAETGMSRQAIQQWHKRRSDVNESLTD